VWRDPNSHTYPAPGAPDRGTWAQVVPGRAYTVAALTLAAVATIVPLIPAVAAIALAGAGRRRGDPLARTAFILSIVALVAGLVVAALATTLDPDVASAWTGG
jgi:hypothetical protein